MCPQSPVSVYAFENAEENENINAGNKITPPNTAIKIKAPCGKSPNILPRENINIKIDPPQPE